MNKLFFGDSLINYKEWDVPTVIISDGPYGINGYEGDSKNIQEMILFYEKHIQEWSNKANAQTTLWFWNTEIGWANIHPILERNGWIYKSCNIWDKGIKHIAGNCNGKTMRKFPVVTEVCVHYVREEKFLNNGKTITLQHWLREEWKRTGLPFTKANDACNVKNAASRKYLAKDHLWYCPPKEEFKKLVNYANTYGLKKGIPYFSQDGKTSLTDTQWEKIRGKFNFEYGVTNVWSVPALRNSERIKVNNKIGHPNQKPLDLMKRIILASSDEQDLIWEPFLGLATGCIAAKLLNRKYVGSEINKKYYELANERIINVK